MNNPTDKNDSYVVEQQETILLVEDDDTMREVLALNLEKEGYRVVTAADGSSGLDLARAETPDLIILDVMLPGLDGLTVCRILRRELEDRPIIMISARTTEVDKIVGLDSGADDYLAKPFGVGELLARIRAVMRRRLEAPVGYLESGNLTLDMVARKAQKGQNQLSLSYKEFDLLAGLMCNKGVVLTREFLLTTIWGYDRTDSSRTVDVHIRWLRAKIEDDPSKPTRIITIPRVGYRFEG